MPLHYALHAYSKGPLPHPCTAHALCEMQVRPGVYNEDMFRGLDFVLAEAGKVGIKVILSLADNWKYHGGVDEVRGPDWPIGRGFLCVDSSDNGDVMACWLGMGGGGGGRCPVSPLQRPAPVLGSF